MGKKILNFAGFMNDTPQTMCVRAKIFHVKLFFLLNLEENRFKLLTQFFLGWSEIIHQNIWVAPFQHHPGPAAGLKKPGTNRVNDCHKQQLDLVGSQLNEGAKRAIEQNRENGASSWLSVLPLRDHGFTLNNEEFRDALALRYNRKEPLYHLNAHVVKYLV